VKAGSDLFIVDNSDSEWKVRSYLSEWCDISSAIDIATGYFEIGALLCLKEKWQGVERIRVLMGDEVSRRTRHAFEEGLRKIVDALDSSIEEEKKKNDFLDGVPAVVEAIRAGKIVCRVYRRDKFHAKAYITHGRTAVVGSFALVGSSNLTYPGLNENVELNVQVRGPEVGLLQEWYEKHWQEAGFDGVEKIDGSSSQKQRSDAIRRFAPYYNGSSSVELAGQGKKEIRVLVATDILAEGLNLQDASLLINYDLHWNPVRLMQRIGRVDRRMSPEVEAQIVLDHPELKGLRQKVFYWNFLPPEELDDLLRLYQRVSHKTLMISRALGVETGKLFRKDDTFEQVKDLNKLFDGEQSESEKLRLEYQKLLRDDPELAARLDKLPLKVFSGREHPRPGVKAVFLCARIPRPDPSLIEGAEGQTRWSESAGDAVWVLVQPDGSHLARDPALIAEHIRSLPDTPRSLKWDKADLAPLRKKVEKQLIHDYLRPLNAPVGVSPVLKCWMELH